ncbi:MAG TPA: TetR/AcrR family transcriptional regulator, partial [Bacillus sp. (in: firmicutes)]
KGTFYNYFTSKGELLIAIFKNLQLEIEKEKNIILIGHSPSDIEIFIKQLTVDIRHNRKNKLFFLFNEVFISKEPELIQFLQKFEFLQVQWLFNRLVDLFGNEKKPFLFDCTILFKGMLQQSSRFYFMDKKENNNPTPIIRFCMNRLLKMVDEVSQSKEQLINPQLMEQFSPTCDHVMDLLKEELKKSYLALMKDIRELNMEETERKKYWEILDFIQDELTHSTAPRRYIMESILNGILVEDKFIQHKLLIAYSENVINFLNHLELTSQPNRNH